MGRRIAKKRGLKRKKRTSIEGSVKDALDNYFHSEPKPTLEAIASLADSLNMNREVVRIWFCNQRHKEKRKKLPTTKTPESLTRTRSAARMLTMRNEILDGSTEPIKDCVCSATKNDSVSVQSTTVESSGIEIEPLDPPLLLRMDGCEVTSSTNDVDERPKIVPSCLPDSIVLTSNIFTGHGPSEDPYRNGRLRGLLSRHLKTAGVSGGQGEKIRFAERLVKRCKQIGNQQRIDMYAVPLIKSTGTCPTVERFCFGNPDKQAEHRTILVLGANSSLIQAKFINGIINFIFNVDQEDTFRFQMMEETARKNCLSIYDIHYTKGFLIPYSLTMVVIPYFVDSKHKEQLLKDQKEAEIFQKFLEDDEGIKELDMVCNVMGEIDINKSFLSIFGKDIAESITNLLPFNYLQGDTSWKEVNQSFFDMITSRTKKTLLLTKQVLKERKKIEEAVMELESLIKIGRGKIEEMEKAKQRVNICEAQWNVDNFEVELTEKLELADGEYANNCNHCYVTCHANNSSLVVKEENEEMDWSSNFSELYQTTMTNFCSVCPEKCSMSMHSNQPYRWVSVKKESMILPDQTRDEANVKWMEIRSNGQDAINGLQKDLFENGMVMLEQFKTTWGCIQRLNEMALNGNSCLTQRVFDFLFDAEQHLKELGFERGFEFRQFKI